jgi:hypothetical protein
VLGGLFSRRYRPLKGLGSVARERRALPEVKQRGRAVAHEIMRDAIDVSEVHRQYRMRAHQHLALTLPAYKEHQRIVRWIQVQAHHVAQLLDEQRIVCSVKLSTRWVLS